MAVFLELKYEKRNREANRDSNALEWLNITQPQAVKAGKQGIAFEGINVPVKVGAKSITVFVRDIEEADRVSVVLPLLPGYCDTDEPDLDLADPSFGEAVFDYNGLSNGDVVLFIYGEVDKRASLVFVNQSER